MADRTERQLNWYNRSLLLRVDVSHGVEDGTISYRGRLPASLTGDFLSREQSWRKPMANGAQDFQALMQSIRAGSQDAAKELFDCYGQHILRVVRRKLHRRLRSKFDSIDFVQAVWASFFAVAPEKYTFQDPEALIAFLAALAQNKVVEAVRQRLLTQKYNVNRERHLEGSASDAENLPSAAQPTPSQEAVAREEWDRLLRNAPAHHQEILQLLRLGHTHREIAQKLGIHEKTVQRLLKKLQSDLPP